MKILGLSAFYHDSAAALIIDGEIIAAAQEERFTRKKFDSGFPSQSIQFCLEKAGLQLSDLDEIVYYEKPFLSFERLLQSIIATAPRSFLTFLSAMPIWMREKLDTRGTLKKKFQKQFPGVVLPAITFSQHHLSHAASAFYPSPFESAAILCLDGVGEWACTTAWVGHGNKIESLWEMHFPHSLGMLYSAFTYFCGFKVNSGEYKLMGLAPYGKPIFAQKIKDNLLDIKEDGSFRLNMDYFSFASSLKMTNQKFADLFGAEVRQPESAMTQIYKDLAASIQQVTEEIMVRLARTIRRDSGQENLCLSGGVALNCVANGIIARENIFKNIWIQPAAGDAGSALGAALASYYLQHEKTREVQKPDSMKAAFLGPFFSNDEIRNFLIEVGAHFEELSHDNLLQLATKDLMDQKVVGWFQGSMEYGPRSLGARSILGDPRDPQMQSRMNLKIKYRESFRPFAPIVLAEKVSDVYQDNFDNPYMLLVTHVKETHAKSLPAVTHVDGSARIQAVSQNENPLLHDLLKSFEAATGCPVLVNTSFNVRGEPIVCSPEDALRCFIQTEMDSLFLGSFYLKKENQKFGRDDRRWRVRYELD